MPSLEDQRKIIIDQARAVAERAKTAGRMLTAAEMDTIREKVEAAESLNAQIKEAEESRALFDQIMAVPGGIHPGGRTGDSPVYLDLSPAGRKHVAGQIARAMIGNIDGQRAILPAGETITAIPTTPADPIALGKVATGLLSVLPVQQLETPTARYIRQTARTNNAAAVAPGATKPTSLYGLEPRDVLLRVYAHLSEAVDRFMVEDSAPLATFLASELSYGVLRAVEADVINGASGGPGITGLLQTSGIRVTAFATDILTSVRSAITDAQNQGYDNDLVLAMSASDWATAETTKAATAGTYLMTGPPAQGGPQSLFGVPVVVVVGLPAKTAVLIDRPAVLVYVDRQGIRTDWGSPADTWSKNQVVARTEGRFDLGVLQPGAVAKIGTAA